MRATTTDKELPRKKRSVSETKKKYVASQQGWKCAGCSSQLDATFEVDHKLDSFAVVARAKYQPGPRDRFVADSWAEVYHVRSLSQGGSTYGDRVRILLRKYV